MSVLQKEHPQRPYLLDRQHLNPEQAQLVEHILSGPRKSMPPNLEMWLHNPPFLKVAEPFGAYVTQHAPIPPQIKEIVILTVAGYWQSRFEMFFHRRAAQRLEMDPAQVDALCAGELVTFDDPQAHLSHQILHRLLRMQPVPDALYQQAMETLGHAGVSDLVGLAGLYTMIAWSVHLYDVPVPQAAP